MERIHHTDLPSWTNGGGLLLTVLVIVIVLLGVALLRGAR